jgi:hypothetical protein
MLEPGGVVPGEQDFAGGGLGDEDAEGKIEGDAGGVEHEGRAGFGLPKMRTLVGGMSRPTERASPEWSMTAKSLTPLSRSRASMRETDSSTENLLTQV